MNKLTAERCRQLISQLSFERDNHGMSNQKYDYLEALEIALAVLEQQEKGDDVWIEWGGGDNPATGKFVQVKFRDGMVDDEQPSASYRWYHDPNDCDIIAYRVIENDGREG